MSKTKMSDPVIEQQTDELLQLVACEKYAGLDISVMQFHENGRREWQIRIDYDAANDDYAVYYLGERASNPEIIPHDRHFKDAKKRFTDLLNYFSEN